MSGCIFHNVHFQSCCGCNPECTRIVESKAARYQGFAVDDSHRCCHGLHEQIQKILKNRLQLNSKDIVRLGVSYVNYHEDDSKNWLQIMIEIKENAFIIGNLNRECEGEIDFPYYFHGSFWIGRTRYDISKEVF